ncbi:GNAT family N-acetyltransferase [Flavobacterium sp. DG1-102-2]|uniref:GNAT family N-acetyltransferase n=1 Tax=Flavobacterium sp. DG1-102-2 TaxID=3081663 RepID=UPI002948E16C|nr:GNAT family N-acetyltransferase [Flavobacterium sp. DG1-102-2]MDV6168381.1 GNAT family N-acetyltransferase [Flavobacterium sp. DG1-102-2]
MLSIRKPGIDDMQLYFDWANDPEVRGQSYNSDPIDLGNHKKWFESALKNEACFMYVFVNADKEDVGQVRIQKQNDREALIGISIDFGHRGKGYAKEMLLLATASFLGSNNGFLINAYIKESNLSSKLSFEKAGFQFSDMVDYENFRSFHYIKE